MDHLYWLSNSGINFALKVKDKHVSMNKSSLKRSLSFSRFCRTAMILSIALRLRISLDLILRIANEALNMILEPSYR